MKVKYTILSNYELSKGTEAKLEDSTSTCIDEIISAIVKYLSSIEPFKDGFVPKQQYKLIFIKDKGYDVVVPHTYNKPEESFSHSLRAFLNRSFSSTLEFTGNSAWSFHFWVFKSGDKLLIMEANPKNPSNSIRFTIKVTLEDKEKTDMSDPDPDNHKQFKVIWSKN